MPDYPLQAQTRLWKPGAVRSTRARGLLGGPPLVDVILGSRPWSFASLATCG